MPISLTCGSCGVTLKAPEQKAGATVSCPKCSSPIVVPRLPGTASQPFNLLDGPKDAVNPHTPTNSRHRHGVILAVVGTIFGLAVGAIVLIATMPQRDQPDERAHQTEESPPTPNLPPQVVAKPSSGSGAVGTKSLSGEQIYSRLLRSTVFIVKVDDRTIAAGSGSLIHGPRRLVITNDHVVGNQARVLVFFPEFKNGEVIAQPEHYLNNAKEIGIRATVMAQSARQDLAVLELERVPDGSRPLPLATKSAGIGSKLYSIGASGIELNDFSGTLWRLSTGEARARNRFKSGQFDAMFLENQKPVNRGDSGGPTVNEYVAMVGVVSNGDLTRTNVARDVDVTEVKSFLANYAASKGFQWDGPVADGLPISDDPDVIAKLASDLNSDRADKRIAAAKRLANLGSESRPLVPELVSRLDDQNAQVRSAVEEALDRCNPPRKADIVHFEKALKSGGANAQRYALETFAKNPGLKLSDTHVTVVVGFLGSDNPRLRSAALIVLTNYGPDSRRLARSAAFQCLSDESPAVREAANQLVKLWMPFTEADKPALQNLIQSGNPSLREFAVTHLAPLAPDARTALAWFRPLLSDKNPAVVALALLAIGKQGHAAKECLPDLLKLVDAESPTIAVAALQAVISVGMVAEVFPILKAKVNQGQADPAVRTAAAKGILEIDLTDTNIAVPAYAELTKAKDLATRVSALKKLATCGKAAKLEINAAIERLGDTEPEVKSAALDVIIAVGQDAGDHTAAVQKLATPDEKDGVGLKALLALEKLGPKSANALAASLEAKWDEDAAVKIVDILGGFGKEARQVSSAIFDAVAKSSHPLAVLRQKRIVAALAGMDWDPDPASLALAKIGGDGVVKKLNRLTEWKIEVVNKVKTKVAVNAPDLATQFWAIAVLASIDPTTLEAETRKSVIDKLKYLAVYDPDIICRRTAKLGAAKYEKR